MEHVAAVPRKRQTVVVLLGRQELPEVVSDALFLTLRQDNRIHRAGRQIRTSPPASPLIHHLEIGLTSSHALSVELLELLDDRLLSGTRPSSEVDGCPLRFPAHHRLLRHLGNTQIHLHDMSLDDHLACCALVETDHERLRLGRTRVVRLGHLHPSVPARTLGRRHGQVTVLVLGKVLHQPIQDFAVQKILLAHRHRVHQVTTVELLPFEVDRVRAIHDVDHESCLLAETAHLRQLHLGRCYSGITCHYSPTATGAF